MFGNQVLTSYRQCTVYLCKFTFSSVSQFQTSYTDVQYMYNCSKMLFTVDFTPFYSIKMIF
jgi:hypothetical protein